eukprot:228738-Alexandrium_andersonii.AAC.1
MRTACVGIISAAAPVQRAPVGTKSPQAAIPSSAEGTPRGKQKKSPRATSTWEISPGRRLPWGCLLYTSDAADDM